MKYQVTKLRAHRYVVHCYTSTGAYAGSRFVKASSAAEAIGKVQS